MNKKQSKYVRVSTSMTLRSSCGRFVVKIEKFKKQGTKRIFWAPEVDGLRINKEMHTRMNSARALASRYIRFKVEQAKENR